MFVAIANGWYLKIYTLIDKPVSVKGRAHSLPQMGLLESVCWNRSVGIGLLESVCWNLCWNGAGEI